MSKGFLFCMGVAGLLLSACGGNSETSFTVTSTSYHHNGTIPLAQAGSSVGGGNMSPQLSLFKLPQDTVELAIIMDDETCGTGVNACEHWAVFNLPASKMQIAEGEDLLQISGVVYGRNYLGQSGYEGPAPPPGSTHTYHLTVYAMNSPVNILLPIAYTRAGFEMQFSTRILEKATLTGTFTVP